MLVASDGCLCIWACGYTGECSVYGSAHLIVLKHKYWYIDIPGYGVTAVPPDLYEPKDLKLSKILNVFVCSRSTTFSSIKSL